MHSVRKVISSLFKNALMAAILANYTFVCSGSHLGWTVGKGVAAHELNCRYLPMRYFIIT